MLKNIVYQLAGTTTIPPAEINIKALSAVTRSILPFMVNVEIGTSGEPFAQRLWGRTFTLLKGHTFYSQGANMKIWNRSGRHHSRAESQVLCHSRGECGTVLRVKIEPRLRVDRDPIDLV
jgi:hypothetical protein